MQQNMKLRVLKKSLRRIARDDNLLIITAFDADSQPLFDLFIESFQVGERTDVLIRHLLVLATDQKALQHCRSSHSHCHLLGAEGNSSSAAGDRHAMLRQLEFQQTLVELGYSFATDFFKGDENSLQNVPNGGFMYVKSCSNSIELYKYWTLLCRQYPTADRQSILSKGFTEGVVPFSLRFQFLDTANFGGFCQAGGDLRKVCTVQANCCGSAEEKVRGLRSLMQDWNKYRSLSMEEKEGGGFSWSSTSGCKQ
ncbi:hypothetical protein GW17_00043986 [Ensete ventricosum]|nr:hypothetical protein GW17_00043986 [Ensete ventricosum]